jgi:hypothetical protein
MDKQYYIDNIIKLMKECNDNTLLDYIYQLLLECS